MISKHIVIDRVQCELIDRIVINEYSMTFLLTPWKFLGTPKFH